MRAGIGAGMEFLLLLEWSSRHSEGAIGMYNSAYLFGLFSSRFLAREVVLIYAFPVFCPIASHTKSSSVGTPQAWSGDSLGLYFAIMNNSQVELAAVTFM